MAKKRKPKKNNKTKILNFITWFLVIIALILTTLIAGYYFGYKNAMKKESQVPAATPKEKIKKETPVIVEKKEPKEIKKRLEEVLKKVKVEYNTPAHEIDVKEPPKEESDKRKVVLRAKKPKLAIIVDDVSIQRDVDLIKKIGFPVTMSFLPPRAARPNSAKLAAKEKFYMVHLPLEAMHFHAAEPFTLKVSDSQQKISQRIRQIKKWFPRVRFINNHTGSKFTSNERAMNRLIYALSKNRITFIDSRTIASTKVPKVMKNFGLKYLSRDIFLDNRQDEEYIIGQLKKAVRIAKQHGTAIAICHPHPKTLATLRKAKRYLKGVNLVTVNELY